MFLREIVTLITWKVAGEAVRLVAVWGVVFLILPLILAVFLATVVVVWALDRAGYPVTVDS